MREVISTGYNSTFAIGGFTSSADSFVVAVSFVLRINICDENRHLRQARKRYAQCYEDKTDTKRTA